MPVSITCPGCQTTLRVREELAGKKVKCPRCAQVVTVPGRKEVIEAAADEREEGVTEVKPIARKKAGPARARPDEPEEDDRADRDDREEERPRSKYKPCPQCGARGARRLKWTWWGSFYGPAIFTHVRCPDCGYCYNGRSGGSNLIPAIIFVTIPALLILGVLGFIVYLFKKQGWL
jgi:predicted Zn finger-like uncharacterized protein